MIASVSINTITHAQNHLEFGFEHMPLLKLIWIWNRTVNTEKTQQLLPPSKERENNNKNPPKNPNNNKNYKKKHCSTMNTLKYVYVWSINHCLGNCF